jgi:CRISPR/Cas system endoribonuclease Cas6 (RAMP superfamily)
MTLTKSTFTNNRAHNGGAIFNMLSPLTVSNNTFTNNHAEKRFLDPNSPEFKRLQTTDMKNAVFGNG